MNFFESLVVIVLVLCFVSIFELARQGHESNEIQKEHIELIKERLGGRGHMLFNGKEFYCE